MFDLLSILTHSPELRQKSDFLVMNSTVFIEKTMSILKGYSSTELYLDNDSNGRSVTENLMKNRDAKDISFIYKGHKDMNQWLMENAKRDLVRKREMCLCCHKNKLALLPAVAK
jgi:hypothetical protein